MASNPPIAVDVGTANVRVAAGGTVVRDEPSLVAVDRRGRTVAVGHAAKRLVGRSEGRVSLCRPLEKGVVTDPDGCERLLAGLLADVGVSRRDRVVVTVPLDCTEVERDAAVHAVSGALPHRRVALLREPFSAAVGAGLPVHAPQGSVVVDVGHGITETVVLSLGGIVRSSAVRVGAADFDDAIARALRTTACIDVGPLTLERLQRAAAVRPARRTTAVDVVGRDLRTGLPRRHQVRPELLAEAVEGPVRAILDAVVSAVSGLPADLAADVAADGVVLVGGGSLLPGLRERIAEATGLVVRHAADPLGSVVRGSAAAAATARPSPA